MNQKKYAFYTLRDFQLHVDGVPHSLPPKRTHSLLAALLLRPEPLRRDLLSTQLFPDLPEADGRKRLSGLIWLLRKNLPDLAIELNQQTIHLPMHARWLDLDAYREATRAGDPTAWRDALDLYQRDLLDNFFLPWLVEERRKLRREHAAFLRTVSQRLMAAESWQSAIQTIEPWLNVEPYDEAALRLKLTCLVELGQRGKALAAFEKFELQLQSDIGVVAEDETLALVDAIRGLQTKKPTNPSLLIAPEEPIARLKFAVHHLDFALFDETLSNLGLLSQEEALWVKLYRYDRAYLEENVDQARQILSKCPNDHPEALARMAEFHWYMGEHEEAYEWATQGLMLARQSDDRSAELRVLISLMRIYQSKGQTSQMHRLIERVDGLATEIGDPYLQCQTYRNAANVLVTDLQFKRAHLLYEKTLDLAEKYQYPYQSIEARSGIAYLLDISGTLMAAKTIYDDVLAEWRDSPLRNMEACHLYNYAFFDLKLGHYDEARRRLQNAIAIYLQIEDQHGLGMSDLLLAEILYYQGVQHIDEAIDLLSNHALPAFKETKSRLWQGWTWESLARCYWFVDRFDEALESAENAINLLQQVGEGDNTKVVYIFKALSHLALGDWNTAFAITSEQFMSLMQSEVPTEEIPTVYYGHALVLMAKNRHDDAQRCIEHAYQVLLNEAQQLEDGAARQAVFNRSPFTRQLMQDVYRLGVAERPEGKTIVQLPSLDGTEFRAVEWTIDGGAADEALLRSKGETALRRTRVIRLLQEAHQQLANPSTSHLAQALNVSKRTIRRDLAILRVNQAALVH